MVATKRKGDKKGKRKAPPPPPRPVIQPAPIVPHKRTKDELPIPSLNCRALTRFQKLGNIGSGTYGKVYRALDKTTGKIVAVKQLLSQSNTYGYHLTNLREILLLRPSNHPSLLSLQDICCDTDSSTYLVLELCRCDMSTYASAYYKRYNTLVPPEVIKEWVRSMLSALSYLHSSMILHRDLKSNNILLTQHGSLRIADFGLARYYTVPVTKMTGQVVTLWYRAPELLLEVPRYSCAIDLWSLGCIMAELLLGRVLFRASTPLHLWHQMVLLLGLPNKKTWPFVNVSHPLMRAMTAKPKKVPDSPPQSSSSSSSPSSLLSSSSLSSSSSSPRQGGDSEFHQQSHSSDDDDDDNNNNTISTSNNNNKQRSMDKNIYSESSSLFLPLSNQSLSLSKMHHPQHQSIINTSKNIKPPTQPPSTATILPYQQKKYNTTTVKATTTRHMSAKSHRLNVLQGLNDLENTTTYDATFNRHSTDSTKTGKTGKTGKTKLVTFSLDTQTSSNNNNDHNHKIKRNIHHKPPKSSRSSNKNKIVIHKKGSGMTTPSTTTVITTTINPKKKNNKTTQIIMQILKMREQRLRKKDLLRQQERSKNRQNEPSDNLDGPMKASDEIKMFSIMREYGVPKRTISGLGKGRPRVIPSSTIHPQNNLGSGTTVTNENNISLSSSHNMGSSQSNHYHHHAPTPPEPPGNDSHVKSKMRHNNHTTTSASASVNVQLPPRHPFRQPLPDITNTNNNTNNNNTTTTTTYTNTSSQPNSGHVPSDPAAEPSIPVYRSHLADLFEHHPEKLIPNIPPHHITSSEGGLRRPSPITKMGLDLLRQLLHFDPSQRLSSHDALSHPWFREFPLPATCELDHAVMADILQISVEEYRATLRAEEELQRDFFASKNMQSSQIPTSLSTWPDAPAEAHTRKKQSLAVLLKRTLHSSETSPSLSDIFRYDNDGLAIINLDYLHPIPLIAPQPKPNNVLDQYNEQLSLSSSAVPDPASSSRQSIAITPPPPSDVSAVTHNFIFLADNNVFLISSGHNTNFRGPMTAPHVTLYNYCDGTQLLFEPQPPNQHHDITTPSQNDLSLTFPLLRIPNNTILCDPQTQIVQRDRVKYDVVSLIERYRSLGLLQGPLRQSLQPSISVMIPGVGPKQIVKPKPKAGRGRPSKAAQAAAAAAAIAQPPSTILPPDVSLHLGLFNVLSRPIWTPLALNEAWDELFRSRLNALASQLYIKECSETLPPDRQPDPSLLPPWLHPPYRSHPLDSTKATTSPPPDNVPLHPRRRR